MAENTLTEVLDEKPAEGTTSENADQNYLDTLVGEGRKYATNEELAKAYDHADRHITTLEDKLDETQDNKKVLEEVLSELRNQESTAEEGGTGTELAKPKETAKDEGVDDKIAKAIERNDLLKKARVNSTATMQLLVKHYGTKGDAIGAIRKLVGEDKGLRDTVDHLGNTNPAMAFRFVTGQELPKQESEPNAPGVEMEPANTIVSKPSGIKTNLTWTECKKIRKDDPRRFKSALFQAERMAAATEYHNAGLDFTKT